MKHKLSSFIEPLESRIAPATFTVLNNADSGPGSLRQSMFDAEEAMGTDTIAFNLPPMQMQINLLSSLPQISSPLIIDGRSQPGYVDSPLVTVSSGGMVGTGFELTGMANGSSISGLAITNFSIAGIIISAPGVTVSGNHLFSNSNGVFIGSNDAVIGGMGASGRNVISGNASEGIFAVSGVTGLQIYNNYIGTNAAGTALFGNGGNGIHLFGVLGATIGGFERNVIAGHIGGAGILIESSNAVNVAGNYIGLYADGTFNAESKNATGVQINGGSGNTIVASNVAGAAQNFISNNTGAAVRIADDAGNVTIKGNFIGVAPGGMFLVPAGNGEGVRVNEGYAIIIGGTATTPGEVNIIGYSTGAGVIAERIQGVDVRGNRFYDNGTPAIDLLGDGPTPNHVIGPDPMAGMDETENFPVLEGAFADPSLGMGGYVLKGFLDAPPDSTHRVDVYGYAPGTDDYTYVGSDSIQVGADATRVTFSILGVDLTGFTRVAATATNTVELLSTSELSAPAVVGPGIFFNGGGSITEGNVGATLLSFTVQLTATPTGAVSVDLSAAGTSTATLGVDYTFTPSVLNFNATTTQQMVTVAITGDTLVEPRELIDFILSNVSGDAVIASDLNTITINNDDTSLRIMPGGKVATWKDVDGDLVTLKATKGILDPTDFQFDARGTLGGEVLLRLAVNNDGDLAKGIGLAFTAKFDKVNNLGDGSVHVGLINASGVDLGIVTLPGDLALIYAGDANLADGAVKSLTVGSMGALGNSQTAGTGIGGYFNGKVSALTIKGDFLSYLFADTSMTGTPEAGSFGSIVIGGSFFANDDTIVNYGQIYASGSIGSVKIAGAMVVEAGSNSVGEITALGKIGTIAIAGGIHGDPGGSPMLISAGTSIGTVTAGALNNAVISAGTTLGKVTTGEMNHAKIFAVGNANPATSIAALAIAGVTVRGRVSQSEIGAGASIFSGSANPDAQIGAILIGGDWDRSSIHAGASAGADGFFGSDDDALLTPSVGYTNKTTVISKIASVTIKGHLYGTTATGDSYGFVAQSIGKYGRGPAAYTLRPNAIPNAQPLDIFNVSLHGDVFLREVI